LKYSSIFIPIVTTSLWAGQLVAQSIDPLVLSSNSLFPILTQSPSDPLQSNFAGALSISEIPPPNNPDRLETKKVYYVPNGPWGDLEYYVTYLQMPQAWMNYLEIPSDRTLWHFRENEIDQIVALLADSGISELNGLPWAEQGDFHKIPSKPGLSFAPNRELSLALNSSERKKLSEILTRVETNKSYTDPVIIESGDAVSWYREAGLNEELVQLIAKLCYKQGESLVFSDSPLVLSTLPSLDERKKFLRSTSRTRTLVLRLNIGNGDEYREIADYWTAGHKRKAIIPILDSIAETPGVERIDIAHLLPPTPRKLLYTYPDLEDYLYIGNRDCHWTSANFFRSSPNGVQPESILTEILNSEYEPATGELSYGDMIVLKDAPLNLVIHSAIYIAGDIVFTKNGKERLSPWILMRYSDMERRYKRDRNIVTSVFRLKENNE
tara:strand:- start:1743 stop:3056 length:1314 start_codon:yes stop_codon:yes gene_type:complete